MNTKTCKQCGETKLIEAFHRDATKKGGRRHECNVCRNSTIQENMTPIEPFDPDLEFKRRWQNWVFTYGYDGAVAKARQV